MQFAIHAKGRVENSIGYIQKNFLKDLQISSLEALNAQVGRWMEQVANVRVHRDTGKRPSDAFKEEKPTLQPLPLAGYDISLAGNHLIFRCSFYIFGQHSRRRDSAPYAP